MTVLEAIACRHSVRSYLEKPILPETAVALKAEIDACNAEYGLHIQLITDEPEEFTCAMARYGNFSGVSNYIALVGKRAPGLDENLGYCGERIALRAQMLGLNTCWVALSFQKGTAKKRCAIAVGEKLVCVLSLGYGATQGVPHRSKPLDVLYRADCVPIPNWFIAGVEAAQLAPTAINQQQFRFTLHGDTVRAEPLGGFYAKVDLGIAKYHFEIGSGRKVFAKAGT